MSPKLSVVIPAFNEEKFISHTLQSLTEQTFRDFEVIVVNNNSTDSTAKEASKFANVRVIHEKKAGVCAARQAGLEAAKGEIIVSTDADTVFPKDWLEKINKSFEKDADIVGVWSRPYFINSPLWAQFCFWFYYGNIQMIYNLTGNITNISAANFAYKKDKFKGYNTNLTQGGDELYVLHRLKEAGRVIAVPNNPVFTSNRRLKKGFLYNVIVTMGSYYYGEYFLSHFTKRSVLGAYPAIRDPKSQEPSLFWRVVTIVMVVWFVFFAIYSKPIQPHDAKLRSHIHRPTNQTIHHMIPHTFQSRDII